MYEALTIGSALADIFITSSEFELQQTGDGIFLCQMYGSKIEIDSFMLHTGGGAGNVAVGLARAGLSVAAIVELGKDLLARLVLEDLQREHVDCEYVISERHEQTGGSVILVGHDGGRTVMVHRGASSLLDPKDIPERAVQRASWVHLSSIAGRLSTLKRIGKLVDQFHKPLSWNPGRAELALLASRELTLADFPCQIMILNREEWSALVDLEDEVRAVIPELIITDGREGLDLWADGRLQHVAADLKHKAVDETGAGDGFASGYIAARFHGLPPEKAVAWGIRNASAVVSQMGAKTGLLTYKMLASSGNGRA